MKGECSSPTGGRKPLPAFSYGSHSETHLFDTARTRSLAMTSVLQLVVYGLIPLIKMLVNNFDTSGIAVQAIIRIRAIRCDG